jgi:hypothetical protein
MGREQLESGHGMLDEPESTFVPGQIVRARAAAIAYGPAINATMSARVFLGRFVIRSDGAQPPRPRAMLSVSAHGRAARSSRDRSR